MSFKEAKVNYAYLNRLNGVCGFCGSKSLDPTTKACLKCGTTNPNSVLIRRQNKNVSSKDST